jgi:hypothetical protein
MLPAMTRVALAGTLIFVGACGLFDVGDGVSDGAASRSGGDPGGGPGGGPDGETYGETFGEADGNNFLSTQGPTTTGIEPTGADNMLPDDEMCPCVEDNDDIYVLSDLGSIWIFDPLTAEFDFVTDIACGGMTQTFSMGVSRKARAWVQYFTGDLYTVDLKNGGGECKDPGFDAGSHPLFPTFGMAFVANAWNDPCDKLYAHSGIAPDVVGEDVGALGVIDPQTLALQEIAKIDYGWGELTGTGDGRMFAFSGTSPTLLIQYDKDTGATIDTWPLPALSSPDAFAFAAWGGDFYFFTEPDPPTGLSIVTHLDFDGSDGEPMELSVVVDPAPIRIVGAGVSTCAPPAPQ